MQNHLINAAIHGAAKYYLDPGSGSMLIQLILGAVLGLGVVVRVFWKNIKDFFTRGKGNTEDLLDPTQVKAEVEDPSKNETL